MRQIDHKRKKIKPNGFSLPEVMVSSSILMLIIANTTQIQIDSGSRIIAASNRDEIATRIRADINTLREAALSWECKAGTACTGDPSHANTAMMYNTADTNASNFSTLKTHCENDTLGSYMLSKNPNEFPSTPTLLTWNTSATTSAKSSTVTRKIVANKNSLNITYTAAGRSGTTISNATVVPEAMHWCP